MPEGHANGSQTDHAYAWQKEWRFIWIPDTEPVGEPKAIEFPIGSLSDIAVLERLEAAPVRK